MDAYQLNVTETIQPPHPFYPVEANIIGYLANEYSALELVGMFALGCVLILGSTLFLLNTWNPRLEGKEKASVIWFILSESPQYDPVSIPLN